MARSRSKTTTDHEEIRRWAEERGGRPACVRGTGGDDDVGMIRIDFAGYSGEDSLEHISWDDWFRKFDESNLALIYQDTTAGGQKSNFNKLVARENAETGVDGASRRRGTSARGRTGSRSTTAARSSRSRSAGSRRSASSRSGSRSSAKKRTSRSSRRSASTRASSSSRSRTAPRKRAASRNTRASARKSTSSPRQTTSRSRSTSRAASSRSSRSRTAPGGSRSTGGRKPSVPSRGSRRSSSTAIVTTDHNEIRRWAEERGAKPACVRGTGRRGDIGMIRLDFPGFTGGQSLEHIGWDEWFKAFDENGLALLHQDTTARGQKSNFNKLISREGAQGQQRGGRRRAA